MPRARPRRNRHRPPHRPHLTDPASALDLVFRRQYGRLVAALTRLLGRERFDLAEEAVGEALAAAVRAWPLTGVPDDPSAWLLAAARNRAFDELRRRKVRDAALPELERRAAEPAAATDDPLRLMFLCCHDSLRREDQVALTLKAVAGFGTAEIARAFFVEEDAVAQRVLRAKKRIQESGAAFDLPDPEYLGPRVGAVLDALYLMFNEGYTVRDGEEPLRQDVMDEAIRLAQMLVAHPAGDRPETHALLALLFFQSSRLHARFSPGGELLPLESQDRSLWDRARIAAGVGHLDLAARGGTLTEYHLLAGIAVSHATAPSWEATDWLRIVSLYNELARRTPTFVVRLNRAVAVSMADGPAAGLRELEELEREDPSGKDLYLVPAARADAFRRMGNVAEARREYARAARMAPSAAEKRFLDTRAKAQEL